MALKKQSICSVSWVGDTELGSAVVKLFTYVEVQRKCSQQQSQQRWSTCCKKCSYGYNAYPKRRVFHFPLSTKSQLEGSFLCIGMEAIKSITQLPGTPTWSQHQTPNPQFITDLPGRLAYVLTSMPIAHVYISDQLPQASMPFPSKSLPSYPQFYQRLPYLLLRITQIPSHPSRLRLLRLYLFFQGFYDRRYLHDTLVRQAW